MAGGPQLLRLSCWLAGSSRHWALATSSAYLSPLANVLSPCQQCRCTEHHHDRRTLAACAARLQLSCSRLPRSKHGESMALPVMQQRLIPAPGLFEAEAFPAAHAVKQRAAKEPHEPRRPAGTRRQSLRRVKDSKEELRRTRTRGASSATIESSTPSTAPSGRSFTVANVNRGIIYLRYGLPATRCLLGSPLWPSMPANHRSGLSCARETSETDPHQSPSSSPRRRRLIVLLSTRPRSRQRAMTGTTVCTARAHPLVTSRRSPAN